MENLNILTLNFVDGGIEEFLVSCFSLEETINGKKFYVLAEKDNSDYVWIPMEDIKSFIIG